MKKRGMLTKTSGLGIILAILLVLFSVFPLLSDRTQADAATTDMVLEDGMTYFIKNQHSGMYMDVKGRSTKDKAVLHQYTWTGNENQSFTLKRISGDIYELIPGTDSNKRVDIDDNASSNNATVWQ